MKTVILVATHKKYRMPEDNMYLPLHVGKACSSLSLSYTGDNTGTHISEKNPNYCELTALYWARHNLSADAIGLVHYRRHFSIKRPPFFCKDKFPFILTSTEVEPILEHYDLILPKKRNYFIETNYSQYIHAHPAESLDKTKELISQLCPDYLDAYDRVMNRTKAHRFNMFIMKQELFHAYCDWLFPILFRLEQSLDISSYNAYNQRIFGFISERLLDVFIERNNLSYKELPFMFMESENWIKKGGAFLKRKFFPKHP